MPRQKLTQRKDGRYACKYDGKYFYGKSSTEAIRKRDEYLREKDQGYNTNLSDTTFLEYSKIWLKTYRSECNPSQYRQYESFLYYAAENMKIRYVRDITATDIQRLFNTLRGYSQSHITKFTSTIRSLFKAAVQDGIIIRNPADCIQVPKGSIGGHRALDCWEQELVESTYQEHDFGLCAMVMMYAGLRRGEALYLDIDRDVDFKKKTLTVRGAVSFSNGNQGHVSCGKTKSALRTIPLAEPLERALHGHHGLLCCKEDGMMMSQSSFDRKFESYCHFLEKKMNGCSKGHYGKLKNHKELIAAGHQLPPWKDVSIRCHDFRVTFCTMCFNADIPAKTVQVWMGHSDTSLVMNIYTKLTEEKEQADALKLNRFIQRQTNHK